MYVGKKAVLIIESGLPTFTSALSPESDSAAAD